MKRNFYRLPMAGLLYLCVTASFAFSDAPYEKVDDHSNSSFSGRLSHFTPGKNLKRVAGESVTTPNDQEDWQDPDFSLEATHNPTTITIRLTDRSHLDARYEIHGSNSLHIIEEADSGQVYTFVDQGNDFVPGHTYNYFVDAHLHDGTYMPNVAGGSITTPLDVPAFGPWREPFDETVIRFNTMNAAGSTVEVYRSESPDSGFILIGTSPAFGEFTDTNVSPGEAYWYRLRGTKDGHEPSDFSESRRYVAGSRNYNPTLTYDMVGENTVEVSFTDHDYVDTEYYISYEIEGGESGTHNVSLPDSGQTVSFTHENVPSGATISYGTTMFVNVHPDAHINDVATFTFTTSGGGSSCENTGGMHWEIWSMVPGTSVSDIPLNRPPDEVKDINTFETPQFFANEYGSRIRGYLCPPETGSYFFRVSGDDNTELWLSTDENPANKQRIAYVPGHTGHREWDKYPNQVSAEIMLQAGSRYYVEVLHKEGGGNDHISVGWDLPGGTFEGTPIAGQYMIAFDDTATPSCENTGSIKREIWTNISGTDISSVPFNTAPDQTETYTSFETPQYYANNYGSRMRGYVCVPSSGAYTFMISSDDRSELWLSTDENPDNAVMIAEVTGYTPFRSFDKYASQTSDPVNLVPGSRYYIEVRHKEAGGNDHITVGWQMPGNVEEIPIPGHRLIPFVAPPVTACADDPDLGSVEREIWRNIPGTSISSIPTNETPDNVVTLTAFETGTYYANEYGSRIRAYLCVPQDGDYTFWIASDDNSELWLSTDDSPANKMKIASVTGHTQPREWMKYPSQQSGTITLEADQKYYVEVLHKEAGGNDHIAVGWTLPDGTMERPIPGNRLIRYRDENTTMATENSLARAADVPEEAMHEIKLYPNPTTARNVTLSIVSNEPVLSQADVQVVDFTGKVVYAEKINCEEGCADVLLTLKENVPPGLYVVNVLQHDKKMSTRLVIK